MTECRHGLSEDCPACMQATIDEWKQAASVEAGLRREFLARAERAEKALRQIVDGSKNADIGNSEFRLKALQTAQGVLSDVGSAQGSGK